MTTGLCSENMVGSFLELAASMTSAPTRHHGIRSIEVGAGFFGAERADLLPQLLQGGGAPFDQPDPNCFAARPANATASTAMRLSGL